jgi:hypothetical protein
MHFEGPPADQLSKRFSRDVDAGNDDVALGDDRFRAREDL